MKISLAQQIDEIDRELAARKDVYARLVATGKMRQSIAEFQTTRLTAARATLAWLAEHETEIRAIMAQRRQAAAATNEAAE